ncbi:trehalose-phosphatase [Corynebacterium comes]|uniref:Trehalose 6-phosphate phosphatase n=1 Tax=Corynebacterium comes TaxID=2675218 RepID=A0A6B8VJI2_9CORY|nr:trehalose-phosphatase [Corynebacterium comes]QGU05522.1 Trehalose-6-phosphate phosphatase [Corynebacterium comes]
MSLPPATIARLATAEKLLVVSDFDGTLAGFSPDIYAVPVNLDSVAALTRLAGLPDTHVALLTGRHLEGLAEVCPLVAPVVLAGSHGSESAEHAVALTDSMLEKLSAVEEQLAEFASHPVVYIEYKPFQRVAHAAALASTDQAAADSLLDAVMSIDIPGVRVTRGKNIVEFSVSEATKGTWLAAEIERVQPTVAVFIGDDATDEDGFRSLREGDVGVKVGEGETAATERIADIPAVAELLTSLADARAAHLGLPRTVAERFEAISAGFSAEVHRVHDWSAATPCEGWSARDIVNHLLTWYPANLRNADVDLTFPADLQADPAGAWFEFVSAVRALLADPSLADAPFTSGPDEGQTVARATAGFLLPDIFMHTWDLARSQGRDVTLDADYAARNLAGLESLGDSLRETGRFGPAAQVSPDASAGVRLMAYVGRDPGFGLEA